MLNISFTSTTTISLLQTGGKQNFSPQQLQLWIPKICRGVLAPKIFQSLFTRTATTKPKSQSTALGFPTTCFSLFVYLFLFFFFLYRTEQSSSIGRELWSVPITITGYQKRLAPLSPLPLLMKLQRAMRSPLSILLARVDNPGVRSLYSQEMSSSLFFFLNQLCCPPLDAFKDLNTLFLLQSLTIEGDQITKLCYRK